ncbi:hypothetical protein FS837_000506 [Tulasnella sp. UAMH 9824]|nr:hypothetical protein FS837_000506 [Tulasnella sp. UAMH 9824]
MANSPSALRSHLASSVVRPPVEATMEPKRAINDPKWVQGVLWNLCIEAEIDHVGGRSARGQMEWREIHERAAEMFLESAQQKVEIERWLELALGEPPEYKSASTSDENRKRLEQEYATHYTRCLWDLRPPNHSAFEAKLQDLRTYHNGFKRSIGLQKLKDKRLERKKKKDPTSGPGEFLDPEHSAPHGKVTALDSGAALGAHFEQLFPAEAETVQPGLRERSGSNAERHTSPATMDLQSKIITSPAITRPLADNPTPASSTNPVPTSKPPVKFDIWGDDESLTELSSDESIALKPSPKKAKLSYRRESANGEPSNPMLVSNGLADELEVGSSGVDRMPPEIPLMVKPSPRKPMFSYGSESEIDEPLPPRPAGAIDSGLVGRNFVTSKSKRKRCKAQSRIATELPVRSQQPSKVTRSSFHSSRLETLSPTSANDPPQDQIVAQLTTTNVGPHISAASEARGSEFYDAQLLGGELPSSLVAPFPAPIARKKPKRKRANSPMTTSAFDPPGETKKAARKKRSSHGNGIIQNFPSESSIINWSSQDEDFPIYAEIALEEKGRRSKRARKSYQRSATQKTHAPNTLPNIPSMDAAEGVQRGTSSYTLLLSSTDASNIAAVDRPEECTRFLEEQPSAFTTGTGNTDGSSVPPNLEVRDYSRADRLSLNPATGGIAASRSPSPRGSPVIGDTGILSSPPAEQPRRRKRKLRSLKLPALMQGQQQVPQQGVAADAITSSAEAVPSKFGPESRPKGDIHDIPQTIPENGKPTREPVKARKGRRKGQSAITPSSMSPPEITAPHSLYAERTEQTPPIVQPLNRAYKPSQIQPPSFMAIEGVYDGGPSRILAEPAAVMDPIDLSFGTAAGSLQSTQLSEDDTVRGGEVGTQKGAISQSQDPHLFLTPPQTDPEISSQTEHQYLSVPPEAPPSTRPLASIVPDEILTVQYPRPRLPAKPQVWCMTRQELCEGTAYFRSYQGGVYANDGLARGYMLDGYGAPRDICAHNGKLIISHAGGSSHQVTRVDSNGRKITNTELRQDQEINNGYAKYLHANWKLGKPVVLLVGKNYPLFPFDLEGKTYVILGWYRVIEMWTELESMPDTGKLFKRLKVAFQWIADQGTPFFDLPDGCSAIAPDHSSLLETSVNGHATYDLPDDRRRKENIASRRSRVWKETPAKRLNPTEFRPNCSEGSERGSLDQDTTFTCSYCKLTSPIVYKDLRMCLRGDCPLLWKLADGTFPYPDNLVYTTSFLQLREQTTTSGLLPYSIVPGTLPDPGDYGDLVTGKPFTKAMYCTICGRLSCRVFLTKWVCAGCGASIPISFGTTKRNHAPPSTHLYLSYEISGGMINAEVCFVPDPLFGMVTAVRYILANNCGVIWHLQANPNTQKRADLLLEDFQVVEHFQRERLSSTKTTTTMLGSQFVMNSGMPYHYVSEATTVSLDNSPPCVAQALDL